MHDDDHLLPPEPEEPERYRTEAEWEQSLLENKNMKRFEYEQPVENPLREQFWQHVLRIAADIAGGHGLGYDEETLCGNIVKNCWVLGHAQEAKRLFTLLIERDGADPQPAVLLTQAEVVIHAIEERLAELRARVWWDQ